MGESLATATFLTAGFFFGFVVAAGEAAFAGEADAFAFRLRRRDEAILLPSSLMNSYPGAHLLTRIRCMSNTPSPPQWREGCPLWPLGWTLRWYRRSEGGRWVCGRLVLVQGPHLCFIHQLCIVANVAIAG